MSDSTVDQDPARAKPDRLPVQPVAWKLLLIPAAVQLLLHLFTNGRYGVFRDEYYYLACAARPAWGYVDQPPFSIWVLAAWKAVFGNSVHSIRILPALCGSGLIVLTGAVAAQLGGRSWGQMLAGIASGIGAVGLVIGGFYSMNCFDLIFWTATYYLLIRIARTGDGRWWVWMGLVLGLGLFNKVGLLVFGMALVVGLAATRHRRHFLDRRLYLAGAIAVVFLVPYVLWNMTNDWPTLEFIENAKRYKISSFSPLGFLSENVLEANPLTVPLWMGGLLWLLVAKRARPFRIVAVVFLSTWVLLVVQRSKPYYFAASFPVVLAAGGVAWEAWTSGRRWRWVRWALVGGLVAGLLILMPIAIPVLSPAGADAYQKKLGIVPDTGEVGHDSSLPQYFSDRFGWEELARAVSDVYTGLPEEERQHCIVWGRNYGHAGALEYWSDRYELPPVFSTHNNYFLWGPPPSTTRVVIAIRGSRESHEEIFEQVIEAGVVQSPFAMESRMTVWLCKGLRGSVDSFWKSEKMFI